MTGRWDGPGRSDRWDRDAAALLASEHREQRQPDPDDTPVAAPDGTILVRAALREGERKVLGFSCGVLCEVNDPPGYGFRLVGLLVDGETRVIELPGYAPGEAIIVARTWANYPEVIGEAASNAR